MVEIARINGFAWTKDIIQYRVIRRTLADHAALAFPVSFIVMSSGRDFG
jgi:hypothetical protein